MDARHHLLVSDSTVWRRSPTTQRCPNSLKKGCQAVISRAALESPPVMDLGTFSSRRTTLPAEIFRSSDFELGDADVVPIVQVLGFSCAVRTSCVSSTRLCLFLSRLSKCPRSCQMRSLCAPLCVDTQLVETAGGSADDHILFLVAAGLWSSMLTFPVPGRGGRNAGLQGFLPNQSFNSDAFF